MKIYITVDESNTVWGWASSRGSETDIEVEISETHPFLNDRPIDYVYVDGEIIRNDELLLNRAKSMKDEELNKACQDSILVGFDHKIGDLTYHFSYDREAQVNFGDSRELLKDGIVEEIMWTVQLGKEYVRIPINFEEMQKLTISIMNHKMNNISRYRDVLLPLVKQATTIDEVNAITWDMEV